MRIILVDNFFMPEAGDLDRLDVHPHLGLTSLAAVAIGCGHEVLICDPKREVRFGDLPYNADLYDAAAARIMRTRPDAVGFTSLACSFLFAANVAARIKQIEPDLPILLGGPHATMLHLRILAHFQQFDAVVRYEAEATLPQVLARLEQREFGEIPGISWRSANGTIRATAGEPKINDLDALPFPAYDLYPVEVLPLDLMHVEAGRGCPFACTFCSTATFFQRDYRLKSPARLVQEIEFLAARYGASEFKLDHDLFTVSRKKVLAFCDAVESTGYRWRVSARTDCVDEELLERMAAAGCVGLYFGIESGSARIQQSAQKRLRLENVAGILDRAERLGIETTVSFITGYPDEDPEDQAATLDLLGECFSRPQRWCTPQLHILVPEPGTAMFRDHGSRLHYDGYTTRFNARLMAADDRRLILDAPDIFCSYFYYPGPMPRNTYTFAVDAVDLLRTAGHDILGYSLRFFDHSLARLIGEFRAWCRASEVEHAPSAQSLLGFLASRFGPTHHLVSLYRYGLLVKPAPSPATLSAYATDPFDPDRPYELPGHGSILRDSHDCITLLERARALPPGAPGLDDADAGPRASYFVAVAGDRATHYMIDDDLAEVLCLFACARTANEVGALVQPPRTGEAAETALFRQLVALGMLVPAPATAAAHAASGHDG